MNIISQKDDLVADVKIYELKTKLVSLFKEKTFMQNQEKQLDNNEDIKLNDFQSQCGISDI